MSSFQNIEISETAGKNSEVHILFLHLIQRDIYKKKKKKKKMSKTGFGRDLTYIK